MLVLHPSVLLVDLHPEFSDLNGSGMSLEEFLKLTDTVSFIMNVTFHNNSMSSF